MTQQPRPDVSGQLPDAPTPWAASTMPAARTGPPYAMTEMIEAEPALARRLLAKLPADPSLAALADAVRAAIAAGAEILFTGCGTSDHAAQALAAIVADAVSKHGARPPRVAARQAFEVALDPPSGGVLVAVSHEGATWATNRALEAARSAGASTALVTVTDRSPGAYLVDIVVATHELDQSWCHTVAYLSPILVAASLAAALGGHEVGADDVGRVLEAGLGIADDAEEVAARLAPLRQVLVVGSGVDRVAALELALKIEEGAQLPATARDVETILHGHLAATDPSTGLVLIATDRRQAAERLARGRDVLAAAAAIGAPAAAILSADAAGRVEPDLTSAGRIVCGDPARLPPAVGALVATAVPLQLLTERLARARDTNPDGIRRDEAPYAEAAARAERG